MKICWILTCILSLAVINESFSQFLSNAFNDGLNPSYASRDVCTVLGNEGTIDFKANKSLVNECWSIELPSAEYITLSLAYIHMDHNCATNYLLIKSGEYYSADGEVFPSVERLWCGGIRPQTFTVKRDWIKLTLISQSRNAMKPAFKLSYSVADQCMMERQIHSYTIITSVGFPNSNIVPDCAWNISLHHDSSFLPLQFSLNECDLYQSGWISVYDGPNESSPLIWSQTCDETTKTGVVLATSSGPNMLIRYRNNVRMGRGFNATVKAKGYCLPGSYSCGDQDTCYTDQQQCNGKRDCASGFDEMECTPTCSNGLFWCGEDSWHCYSAEHYCDGNTDCANGVDETECKKCAPGAFHCKVENKCIYERWKCDGQADCSDASDELDCSYTASRQVITAAIIGSLICGMLLAIALGCSCKLYTLRSATRNRRTRQVVPTPLGRIARQMLQREAPPSYSMTVDGVDSDSPDSSLRRSSASSRRRRSNRDRRSRRRHRHRDPQLRRARPDTNSSTAPPCGLEGPTTSGGHSSSRPPNVPLPPVPHPIPSPPDDQHPTQRHPEAPASSSTEVPPSTSEPSSSREEQAGPLPKKRRIRPVMVEAPCNDELVEDTPNCVHPNPPSYHEIVDSNPPGSPTLHLHDNRDDIVVEEETPASRTMINRFLARFSPHRSPGFWRNIFRRSNASPPFHELENQSDTGSRDSDSLMLSLDPIQQDAPSSSSSQELDTAPMLHLLKRTVKPSSFYPPPDHIKELEAGEDDEDLEVAYLGQSSRTFSPVEMHEISSTSAPTTSNVTTVGDFPMS